MNRQDIETRKVISDIMRDSARGAKQEKCFICGKVQTSFCNSHLIPRAILENIATDGKVLTSNALMNISCINVDSGLAKTWTFRFICRECDSKMFCNYEATDALLSPPTDVMLAEIALKNSLMMLYKQYHDKTTFQIFGDRGMIKGGLDIKEKEISLNIVDYSTNARKAKRFIEQNKTDEYSIIFYCVLDWKAPIAVQSSITIHRDLKGDVLNDIYDYSDTVRMQDVHLCIFPYEQKTAVLLFYYKNEHLCEKFAKQFATLSLEKKLEYINYLIFRYTEHFALSAKVLQETKNKKLIKLFKQHGDGGEMGVISMHRMKDRPKHIKPHEIPNFLSKKMALN